MEETPIPKDDDLSPSDWKERIWTCFESLRIRQEVVTVETLDRVQMDGRVESLDHSKGRLVLSIPRAPGLRTDDEVRLLFTMHQNRWVGVARIHYHNDRRNRFTLLFPARLDLSDRRREIRLFLDTTENVKATFRPFGAEHLLVSGRLSNLSEGGFRLAVEGVVDERRGHSLDPEDLDLEENQILESLRITGLRDEPVGAEGFVMEVDPQPLGPMLGVRFRSISPRDQSFLQDYVRGRAQAPVIPIPEPRLETPETDPPPETEVFHDSSTDHRLKRFKTLALVVPPGQQREALQAFLLTEGFTRVMPAGTMLELAAMVRKSPPDVILVDWPEAANSGLDIVQFLGDHPFRSCPRLLLACPYITAQLTQEANRLGVSHLLVSPYALDRTLVELILQQMRADETPSTQAEPLDSGHKSSVIP